MEKSKRWTGTQLRSFLLLLKEKQHQAVMEALPFSAPSTPLEAWLLFLAHQSLQQFKAAKALARDHDLTSPPELLMQALTDHYSATKDAWLLWTTLRQQPDPAKRATTLTALLEPEWSAPPDLHLVTLLLEAQIQSGDRFGADSTLKNSGLRLEDTDLLLLQAILSVMAVAKDNTTSQEARRTVEAVRDMQGHQLVALRILLAVQALQSGEERDAQDLMREALNEAESDLMWFAVEPAQFIVTDSTGTQNDTVEAGVPPTWAEALDDLINDDSWPTELRGRMLLLRADVQEEPSQDDVHRARELLGDTVWVQKLTRPLHPLAALLNFKTWTSAYMAEHGTEYVAWPVIPAIPDGLSFTREEALRFHQELLDWSAEYGQDEGIYGAISQARLKAWEGGSWEEALKSHHLHVEMCEAAEAVLELGEDTALLFALGYHGSQTKDSRWLGKAVAAYHRYLELQPGDPSVLNNLGYTYEISGDLSNAEEKYVQALNIKADYEMASRNLTRVRLALRVNGLKPFGLDIRFRRDAPTEERTFALIYWDRTKTGWSSTTKELATSGLTPAKQRDQAKAAAWACSTSLICQDCETPYVFHDRTDFENRIRYGTATRTYFCAQCSDKRAATQKAEQASTLVKQRELIRFSFDLAEVPALDPEDLTLEEAVYLVSLVRAGATEDLRTIEALNTFQTALAATPTFALEMVKHLYQRQLLRIHPASVPEAFDWEDDSVAAFDYTKVRWGIPVGGQQLPFGALIEALESRLGAGPDAWSEAWVREIPDLWRKVVLSEAIRYLLHCLEQHNFRFSPGDKTLLVLKAVLEEYSLGQTWSIIWSRAKDAAAYYVRDRVPRDQAANSTITRIKSYAENAKANGWSIRAARRDFDTPLPTVSQVLFIHALQRGVQYQEELPPSPDGTV